MLVIVLATMLLLLPALVMATSWLLYLGRVLLECAKQTDLNGIDKHAFLSYLVVLTFGRIRGQCLIASASDFARLFGFVSLR